MGIDGFTHAQVIAGLFGVIGGLIVVLLAMIGAFAAWIVRRFDRLETKIDAADTKLSPKIDALTIAVSRLEGATYYRLPEPRKAAE
jgi:hypothetical protein